MIDNSEAWSNQAEEIINRVSTEQRAYAGDPHGRFAHAIDNFSEAVQFATSMLTALYGAESSQLKQFRDGCAGVSKSASTQQQNAYGLLHHAVGAMKSANRELKAGLIVWLRVAVAGEILTELIGLAKEVLEERTDAAKNTSAVLVAAAFENLIRRMGEEFAGVTTRLKLQEVITALKDAGVLKGGQIGVATSYLRFRNDSLHADWSLVDRSQVDSCLAFIESLLVKHFS